MRRKYLIIIMVVIILSITGCSRSSSNIKKYLNSGARIDTYAKDFMPAIEDLPKYKDISYRYKHKSIILFESDSMTLVVEYDDETYESEKEKLANKYNFLNEKIPSKYDEDLYFIPEYQFSINSYNFKVVEGNDKSKAEYPKSFGIIGTSDENKSIAYLYFYDQDLDYIGYKEETHPMANFVKQYFKYDFK